MFITIALIVIVLATFLLIMVNMFSDYSARREQDMRLLVTHAHNVVAETEELLLNQSQLPYSRTLVLVLHYRIVRALKKRAIDPKSSATVRERIAEEERLISEIKSKQHESLAFKPPENDSMAVNQLRAIKKLRAILKSEIKTGIPINPVEIQKEDRRLYVLVMKVNISNLVQKVMEMKRLHQIGSCKQMITKGLDVIHKAGIKDGWLAEKEDLLNQLLKGLDAESAKEKARKAARAVNEDKKENDKEMDAIFGDKKKW